MTFTTSLTRKLPILLMIALCLTLLSACAPRKNAVRSVFDNYKDTPNNYYGAPPYSNYNPSRSSSDDLNSLDDLESILEIFDDIDGFINNVRDDIIATIAVFTLLIGIVQCLWGYKLFKFWIALSGFAIGAILGGLIGAGGSFASGDFDGLVVFIGVVLGGSLGAFLAVKLYFLGVFFTVGFWSTIVMLILFQEVPIAIVLGIIIGIVGAIIQKYVLIFSTAITGGFLAGTGAALIVGDPMWRIVFGIVFSILGICYQLHNNKKAPQQPNMEQGTGNNNTNGYNPNGYNPNGYNPNGYNPNGYNPNGYNPNGYNPNGYNPNGYNPNGYNSNGYSPNPYGGAAYDANAYQSYEPKNPSASGADIPPEEHKAEDTTEKCPRCGSAKLSDAKFCPSCGEKYAQADYAFCESCGAETVPGAKFCKNCGVQL